MTPNDDRLLARIVATLSTVPGVKGIALGGSRAQGIGTPSSDYDIGIYYDPGEPFGHDAMQQAANALGDAGSDRSVTAIGAWGEWIDGGGWLTIGGRKVDLLYGDLRKVERVIEECRAGQVTVAYQSGHPHAFVSAALAGQAAYCQPLWDPDGVIARLKALAELYPPALRQALIERFGWEADFALQNAQKALDRGDVAYVAGCCYRSVACAVQVLFALNARYLLNEKGSLAQAGTLPIRLGGLKIRAEGSFRAVGAGDLAGAIDQLRVVVVGTADLVRQNRA
jgi:predicted nucleotidyltransferase